MKTPPQQIHINFSIISEQARPIFASARINFACIVDVAVSLSRSRSLFLIHMQNMIYAAACHFAMQRFFSLPTRQTVLITCIAFFCLRRSQYIGHRSVVDSDCAPLMNYKTNLLRATSTTWRLIATQPARLQMDS